MAKHTEAISTDTISANIKSMCGGCFSIDRKLHVVNEDSKQMYYKLLDINEHRQQTLLCFECSAILQRVLHFKKQVQRVHAYLTMIYSKKLDSLSKLNIRKMVVIDNLSNTYTGQDRHNIVLLSKYIGNDEFSKKSYWDADEIKNENDVDQKVGIDASKINYGNTSINIENSYINGEKSGGNYEKSDGNYEKSDGNYEKSSRNGEADIEPLAFVKMEDPDLDGTDAEDNYGMEHEVKMSGNGNESGFADSDDEPLKAKSLKCKRKKRRKKEGEDIPSIPKGGKVKEQWGVVSDPRVARKLRDLNIDSGHIALVLLTWEEVEEERRAALASAVLARRAHRCDACAVGFNHRHKLLAHMRKHSEEAGSEVCEFCTIRCKTRAALCAHRRRHRARWVCQWCGWRCSQACVCADHCARAHAAPAPTHRCPHCALTATSLGKLRMHMKSHSPRPECALCGKSFRDKSSLRTHALVHRGEKEHACSVCGKTFMFKKQKEIHEITHMDHQHLYCLKCDVTFKNQTSYYQHMKYNLKHIDPADIKYQCKLCDKKFVKAKRLEEHNLAVHLKLAPIKCDAPECTFACASRAALRSHCRVRHRGRCAPAHVCHLCGHTYKSKKSLESHLRSHCNATEGRREQVGQVQSST